MSVAEGLPRPCLWCRSAPPKTGGVYCSKRCRQSAWRARRLFTLEGADGAERRLAYADPPYPGLARKYYGNEPDYAGEVDHVALVAKLQTYDGWALSTSSNGLREVLPLCPPETRVASWIKPGGVPAATRGPHGCWEPVLFVPARLRRPGVADYLRAQPARFGGKLMGRKPIAFCAWIFELLGAQPGDSLDDLFPGTGVVGSAFSQVTARRPGTGTTSLSARADGFGQASLEPRGDGRRSSTPEAVGANNSKEQAA